MSQDNPEYEIGYGKPPEATRFKKGQTGNPKGRPKGAKGFIASLKRELEMKIVVRESDRSVRISKAEAGAKRLMERALKGDMAALKMVVMIDSTLTELADSTNPEHQFGAAPDKTDDAVLAHFMSRIQEGLSGSGDEEAGHENS